MQQLSTLNTTGPIDYDNLNIITHPRPPRRRLSGISLVPFRPYVKCLTGIREPFLFTNGRDPLVTMGKQEEIFKQNNARCIGSLLADCHISDVIRWDIAGDSTRLPMMCKLWMIVDGAVVERGKPHLVQDAAIQVLIVGRNYRSILSAERRYNKTSITTLDRRRRQSWHDLNEYHSVPYYQYTRCIYSGYQKDVQCDMDNEHLISQQLTLSFIDESLEEDQSRSIEIHNALETVHDQSIIQDRVQISIMTQTEFKMVDNFTEIDSEFTEMFNLNLQTNENLLSYIVNPHKHGLTSNHSWRATTILRNGLEYVNQSVSTGDSYPLWWLQLSTNILLSDKVTNQGEKKEITLPLVSPKQSEQSVQTELDKSIASSSPRIQKSSSSVTLSNQYEIINEINDGNNARRCLPFTEERQRVDSHVDLDSHLSDYQIETSSNNDHERIRRRTSSSRISETDYKTFALALNQQSYSTPDCRHLQLSSHSSTNEIKRRIRTESTSTNLLATLLERYERTLKERQRAIAIVNDELLDINDVLKHYRDKIYTTEPTQPNTALELYQDLSALSSESKEEHQLSSSYVTRLRKTKYRLMPSITSEEMIEAYIPSPRLLITQSPTNSPRVRQPRFEYCDLCLTDDNGSSAWIRYNEQRIDELQKRIDLMLQIDDNEEAHLLFSTINPTTHTVTQRIDDILMRGKFKRRNQSYYYDRILSPRRYNFRLPYRSTQSLQNSPRSFTQTVSRSTTPILKSVRISTDDHSIPNPTRPREITSSKSVSRPIVSILRRKTTPLTPRSRRLIETAHTWKNDSDGKIYVLEQFSIPRYYRLYNDVSFREVYNFSRILQTYVNRNETTSESYSSMIRNFALDQQLPTIASVA